MDQTVVHHCSQCIFKCNSMKRLLKHYEFIHASDPNFKVTCGIEGCPKQYTIVKSLYYHIRKKHQALSGDLSEDNSRVQEDPNVYSVLPQDTSDNDGDMQSNEESSPRPQPQSGYDFKDAHANFLMKMKEINKSTQKACSYISNEMSIMIEKNNDELRTQLIELLGDKYSQEINQMIFNQNSKSAGSCRSLNSDYRLSNYWKDNHPYVEPQELILGHSETGKANTMQYVSIIDTLKLILKKEDILTEVLYFQRSADGKMYDYCDGSAFANNPLFQDHSPEHPVILLHMFNDDFTCVNQLRNISKKYKINATYFVVGNLERMHRSKLDMINLVSLAKAMHVKLYGMNEILQPMIEEIQQLENGVEIAVENDTILFRATISVFSSDNLGAHMIAGHPENFSTSLRLCRVCFIDKRNLRICMNPRLFPMRTKEMYNEQAQRVARDPSRASDYGINRASALNQLQYFHVTGGLPPCVYHDIMQGVGVDLFERVITQLILDQLFSYAELTQLVNNFEFSTVDKSNKPTIITEQLKLNFTQAQMWCFMRHLPLIIGNLIPENHKHWELAIQFLDTVEHVLAPVQTQESVDYMRTLISDFLYMYKELYPEIKWKAKMHYLMHYPEMTLKYGPLISVSTMRFESKNEDVKGPVRRTNNKINILKTMAKHQQMKQSIKFTEEEIFHGFKASDHVGVETTPVQMLDRRFVDGIRAFENRPDITVVTELKRVTFRGSQYSVGDAVVIGNDGEYYQFGKIDKIVSTGHVAPYFWIMKMQTAGYRNHYRCYVVRETRQYQLLFSRDFQDHHPLGIYNLDGESCIVLRYQIN